jgi:hypothetical protein
MRTKKKNDLKIRIKRPHAKQELFVQSETKRIIIRAGRRGGKTTGIAIKAVLAFLKGKRVLYATPTMEQIDKFWNEVLNALDDLIKGGLIKKNETMHTLVFTDLGLNASFNGTSPTRDARIMAKTAWNPDSLRGGWADLLILDEYQLMSEDTWEQVGAPMLADRDGQAIFIYTPVALHSKGQSKARDPLHAAKLYKAAVSEMEYAEANGLERKWEAMTFTSFDNPHISKDALTSMVGDMSRASYNREIMAQDEELDESHLVYHSFDEANNKIDRFPIPDSWLRYVGHDFGTANPAALFFAQDPQTGYLYAYDEYRPKGGRSVAQHVEEFTRRTIGTTVVRRVGGSHQEEEVREAYRAHGWHITEPKNNNVNNQLDRVLNLFEHNYVYIFKDLANYLGEIATCMWAFDSDGMPMNRIKDEHKYHLCACARYVLSDFNPATCKPREIRQYNYYGRG